MTTEDPESALVAALRQMADGGEAEGSKWNITREGVRVRVFYASGSSSYLKLSVPYDLLPTPAVTASAVAGYRDNAAPTQPVYAARPLSIVLRPETATDRGDKEAGLSREVQTGDEAFDPGVYVDTPAEEHAVSVMLAPKAVREAVLELFDVGFPKVEIDNANGDVSATVTYFFEGSKRASRAERAVLAFAKLVRALPRVQSAGRRPMHGTGCALGLAYTLGVLMLFGSIPLYFTLVPAACMVSSADGESVSLDCGRTGCCEPGSLGLVIGLVLAPLAWILARKLGRRAMGGRSDSGGRIRTLSFFAALWTVEATVGLAMLYYWYVR